MGGFLSLGISFIVENFHRRGKKGVLEDVVKRGNRGRLMISYGSRCRRTLAVTRSITLIKYVANICWQDRPRRE